MSARRLPRFARPRAVDGPADTLDHALLARLRHASRPCCRCSVADHDSLGCRWCWPKCSTPYAAHPARAEHDHLEAWLTAGLERSDALALWIDGWRREDPPADQHRPAAASGEIGARP